MLQKIAQNEQPRSHHNEGIGSKACCKQIQKMSSQDRTITRGLAPKQVANNAKTEQPRSHHNEGISTLEGHFSQYLSLRAGPVGEDLGRGKIYALELYAKILDLRFWRSEI